MFKFKAKTHVCISVATSKKGVRAHVSFTELTGKGSVYITKDSKLAEAMRKHPKFGKLFVEEKLKDEPEATVAPVSQPQSEAVPESETAEAPASTEQKTVEFSCVEDGKEYFAETFGISRSKLRTRADIEAAALEHGITIKWPEE